MSVQAVQNTQTTNRNYRKLMGATIGGAAIGAGARYVIPTKNELSSLFDKKAFDSFVTNTAAKTRGANRSILKYAGVGAVAAFLLSFASKVFPKHNNKNEEYSKYGALLDAPDYAVEIMWYGE